MFKPETYIERRRKLKEQIKSGLIIFLGNNESPMNYTDNTYLFRQDSSFLYFWGLNSHGLAATIDVEADKDTLYGNDQTVDDIIWMGPQPIMQERAQKVGVEATAPFDQFAEDIKKALQQGRKVHFLPQYRHENMISLSSMLEIEIPKLTDSTSVDLIKAVVEQRSVKSKEEIDEIESALEIAYEIHTFAMKESKPGVVEQEIVGKMEGIVLAKGGRLAFPVIFSRHGETLHNHYYGNTLQDGDIAVCDAGVESAANYAADITRTIPVSGKFSDRQKEVYEIVLTSQEQAIAAMKPGVKFKDVHFISAKEIATGLKNIGIMQGDPDEAVAAGAHALFLPHGLGHMMGLDVHDMENLGEDYVGYDNEVQRSDQFGLVSLRIGKRLKTGYVLTVEPGIYFIPDLINKWKAENKFAEFINYQQVEKYKDFGGIRIEDNVVVTDDGHRILGNPGPKTVADVEEMASG
ncbi:aminopeptidase P family protein [candidate division KSB1 bacterium]|nr:aminopeptidase P family protein [candidate division KSB1 bacterium]TDI97265.1 MAG: aminopeptidase P family protein [Caldithrix sp.]